jgi:hypothetical protein
MRRQEETGCGGVRGLSCQLGTVVRVWPCRGGVRGDGHALAVVVAHGRIGVVVRDEPLAPRGGPGYTSRWSDKHTICTISVSVGTLVPDLLAYYPDRQSSWQ